MGLKNAVLCVIIRTVTIGETVMKDKALKNKKVYIILFSVLNLLNMILNTDFAGLSLKGAILKLFAVALPVSVIVYMIAESKNWKYKNYILPLGFGLFEVNIFAAAWNSAAVSVYDFWFGVFSMIIIAAQTIAIVLMFYGTLFEFENVRYMTIGSLLFIGAAVVSTVGGAIIDKINGAYGFNPQPLINFFVLILFYFGIFLLAKEKSK